jgi:hypothetical protein
MADHTKFSKPRPPFSRRVPIILTSYELPGILAVWFIFGLLYFYHDVVLPLMAEQPLNVFTWPFVIWFGVLFIGKTLWRYRQEIYGLTLTPEKLKRRTELLELKIREQKLRIELEKMGEIRSAELDAIIAGLRKAGNRPDFWQELDRLAAEVAERKSKTSDPHQLAEIEAYYQAARRNILRKASS